MREVTKGLVKSSHSGKPEKKFWPHRFNINEVIVYFWFLGALAKKDSSKCAPRRLNINEIKVPWQKRALLVHSNQILAYWATFDYLAHQIKFRQQ